MTAFGSDGFTLTPGNQGGYASGDTNMSGRTYVGWNWRGSDSSAVSNTNGSITSTVSANTTAGFSIVTYNLNTSGAQTVGHGLSKPPEFIINKGRDYTSAWWVFTTVIDGSLDYIQLDGTGAKADDTIMSLPTSTTFGQVENYTFPLSLIHI